MVSTEEKIRTKEIFETKPVPAALAKMAIPTIVSQLITLIYNIADTWFIGQTNNPYMVAASSLVLTIFLMTAALANLFGVGGGNLVVRLLGGKDEEEAKKAASLSLVMAAGASLTFSVLCFLFMDPLLRLLGASDYTIGYAKQYLTFVVVIGAVPTVLANTMSAMVRNIGHSKEAGFGLGMGGVLNVILDPIFMFVIFPDGYQVAGAAVATMLSNVITLIYFILTYQKLKGETVLSLPRRVEKIRKDSLSSLFSVGIPAAMSLLLFDLTTMVINRLAAGHGDTQLAAIGIVLKVERLPLNIGIGICLGMTPLVAYNYASKNHKRMKEFFSAARFAGLVISVLCVVFYRFCAPYIVRAFISDADTVRYGTEFLQSRCFATPFMFLSFHMVHFMQAVNRGKVSFQLAVIRQICLNIPILILLNHFFGMSGIVWTQLIADAINVVVSYIIYRRLIGKIAS
ncbi:MAG: MATE family efflux transporter [Lachnospiraceae bacterium]|nr:MATE family efflux transporter [Lachnospiraceae bacterium]MDD7076503.1 MATE family efflux transporter [Lachnospiraceae bacterium]